MKLLLYAPNVSAGGGLVLLQALLSAWSYQSPLVAFLDYRIKGVVDIPPSVVVHWVSATITSRLKAEMALRRLVTKQDFIFCFHGLPPLLARSNKVSVFVQNRLLIEQTALNHFRLKTRLRLIAERAIARTLKSVVT